MAIGEVDYNFYRMIGKFSPGRHRLFFLIGLLLIFSPTSLPGASFQEEKSNPFQLCWQLPSEYVSSIAPAFQNGLIFVPFNNGDLIALDSATGKIVWKTELGGEILSPPLVNNQTVFIVTQTDSSTNNAADSKSAVRAISQKTGIPLWQIDFSSVRKMSLALSDNALLVAFSHSNEVHQLTAFSKETGEQKWTRELSASPSSRLSVVGSKLYFGTADAKLLEINLNDGLTVRQYQIKSPALDEIAVSNGTIIFSQASGTVSALRQMDSKILWTLRTGGAIQNLQVTPRGVLVASLDNFIYLSSLANGERRWRRRLTGRPLSATMLSSETILFLTNGDNAATTLRLKNGKILNQAPLGKENYAVAAPVATDAGFVIPTFEGIYTFTANAADCRAKSAPTNEKGEQL